MREQEFFGHVHADRPVLCCSRGLEQAGRQVQAACQPARAVGRPAAGPGGGSDQEEPATPSQQAATAAAVAADKQGQGQEQGRLAEEQERERLAHEAMMALIR